MQNMFCLKNHLIKLLFKKSAITFSTLFFISLIAHGQTVSLNIQNAPIEKAFEDIKRQTGYSFVYTREQIENTQPLNIHLKNVPLKTALNQIFYNQPVTFIINDYHIVVQTKKEAKKETPAPLPDWDVSGKVINEDGEPIVAATIRAKKSGKSELTDDAGKFIIKGIKSDEIINVTALGYIAENIRIGNATNILIPMKKSIVNLDEAVIKGYYITSKKYTTGTVSKITSKDISNQPVSNPIAALEGRVAGLFITQTNGIPGSAISVKLRGQNSIQNGNSPLFIVDGVPFLNDVDRLTQRSGIMANNPFNTINPGDIESIEILKDADANAIYGSRGANGVILITTKSAIAGKPRLDLKFYTGWAKVPSGTDFLNTKEYLEMRKEAFKNDGIEPTVENAPDFLTWDTTRYVNWKKKLIGNVANSQNAQVSYSNTMPLLKYNISVNYYRESTVFPGNFFEERLSAFLNTTHFSSNKKFSATISGSYSSDKTDLPAEDFTQYINLPPNMYEPFDKNGKLVWEEGGYSYGNPYRILFEKNKGLANRLTGNAVFSYRLGSYLTLKTSVGYNELSFDETIFYPIAAQDPSSSPKGSATFGNTFLKTWIVEPQVDYSKSILTKGKITILIGSTFQETINKTNLATATGYTDDALINSLKAAASVINSNNFNQYKYQAAYGRANFTWNNRHLINFTGRKDGSSRFGPERRFANFWAIGYGWIFSQEAFINNNSAISFGKIKASYGITGNDQIGNYQYLDSWLPTQFPYDGQPSLKPARLFNPDYGWEQNRKLEAGFEIGLINNKIFIIANWFKNKSDNQIIRYTLPVQTGFANVLRNFPGVVENSGTEIELKTQNISHKNFGWQTSANITFLKNRLTSFPGLEESSYANTYVINKPLNVVLGLHYTGIDSETGVYTFEDKNKDGNIDYLDYLPIGDTDPRYYGGLQNNIRFKNFEIDFLFQFVKQSGYQAIYRLQNALGSMVNQPVDILRRWRRNGDKALYERYTQDFGNVAYYPATYNIAVSDAAITDASYIRLKNFSISYNLNSLKWKKQKISSLKLFMIAQNLATFTKYTGADPETQSLTILPPLKNIAAGIQIIF